MDPESCSTCATPLSRHRSQSSQKIPEDRTVSCCGRVICGSCINDNPRFATYCPYCQISSTPSLLPQGLRDPPSYTPSRNAPSGAPPPYTPTSSHSCGDKKESNAVHDEKDAAEDALHFLNHDHDSIASLSLRYDVPADALRRANNITSDHLLLARKTILIPGEYYKDGVSLSPRPVEGEKEELRKGKIRRFMTSCKVSDYDMALLYLEQSEYDLEESMQAYFDDEAWERRHPQACASRGLAKPQRFRATAAAWSDFEFVGNILCAALYIVQAFNS